LPRTPTKPAHVEVQIDGWDEKVDGILSSASKPRWQSFVRGTKEVQVQACLAGYGLHVHKKRKLKDLETKVTAWQVVKKFGGLTARDA
jgi:hypothetical protein